MLTYLLTYTERKMVPDAETNTVDSTDNLTPRKTFYPALPEKAELAAFTAAYISTSSKLAKQLANPKSSAWLETRRGIRWRGLCIIGRVQKLKHPSDLLSDNTLQS